MDKKWLMIIGGVVVALGLLGTFGFVAWRRSHDVTGGGSAAPTGSSTATGGGQQAAGSGQQPPADNTPKSNLAAPETSKDYVYVPQKVEPLKDGSWIMTEAEKADYGYPKDWVVRKTVKNGETNVEIVSQPKDTDNDALPDDQEVKLGTDPKNPDTDGDGLKDGQEVEIGTNPLKADTDGDGWNDGAEVMCKSNPRDADSVCPPGSPTKVTI